MICGMRGIRSNTYRAAQSGTAMELGTAATIIACQ
jgi:hypothetical protein